MLAVPSMNRRPSDGGKAEPARRQHSQDMAARKHDRAVIGRAKASDDAIGAGADVGWLLAIRASVAEQEPAGAVREDFAALAAFVVAVVPFEEVGIESWRRSPNPASAQVRAAR